MENTPTAHADDLPTTLGISKNDPKSRSVNIVFCGWILPLNSIQICIYQPKLRPVADLHIFNLHIGGWGE